MSVLVGKNIFLQDAVRVKAAVGCELDGQGFRHTHGQRGGQSERKRWGAASLSNNPVHSEVHTHHTHVISGAGSEVDRACFDNVRVLGGTLCKNHHGWLIWLDHHRNC